MSEDIKERYVFGTIIAYIEKTCQYIIAVDNIDYKDMEIISIDAEEFINYYDIEPESIINHKIYCDGYELIDDHNCKWLVHIIDLEILTDINNKVK